jgi:hypothetical protein
LVRVFLIRCLYKILREAEETNKEELEDKNSGDSSLRKLLFWPDEIYHDLFA